MKRQFETEFRTLLAVLLVTACGVSVHALEAGPDVPDSSDVISEHAAPAAVNSGAKLDFGALEHIAIQEGGRKKPLHTFALESMTQITGATIFRAEPKWDSPESGERVTGMDLFLSVVLGTRDWTQEPLILVSSAELKRELGLPKEEMHFSPLELSKLYNPDRHKGRLYELWLSAHQKKLKAEAEKTLTGQEVRPPLTELEQDAEVVAERMNAFTRLYMGARFLALLPHPSDKDGTWISLAEFRAIMTKVPGIEEGIAAERFGADPDRMAKAEALIDAYKKAYGSKAVEILNAYIAVAQAYTVRDPAAFTQTSADFRKLIASLSPVYPTETELDREVSYNQFHPFGKAWPMYVLAAVLALFALRFKENKGMYAAMWLAFAAAFGLHVYGFIERCMIAGRPPVTNMYESVIWVGFGIVFFSAVFETIFRPRYYLLCGAIGGTICLLLMDLVPVIAGNAGTGGFESKIDPLQPVLRSNFWLTIHVLTITLSYAAFALAWILGHVTLVKHLTSPSSKAVHHELHQFVYRVLQIGVLLLATGTILGGVWAYYSWGRFWGWDPKETWAFIALLCYLVVLHGRFTGWWGNFGMSIGSVVAFIGVVMAWYGVNFVLGSGKHAYASGASSGNYFVFGTLIVDLIFVGVVTTRFLTFQSKAAAAKETDGDAPLLVSTDPVRDARHATEDLDGVEGAETVGSGD